LKRIESEHRPATASDRDILARFPGFGPVALSLFPDPVTGQYKESSWQALGEELKSLLTAEEYASAKRTTFSAFYTSPVVIEAMHDALARLGVPAAGTVLEPGCGTGNFLNYAPPPMKFVGVELDSLSGRIAKAIHPDHDIRIEDFHDTRLPENGFDAIIGNVPFADIRRDYRGQKLSLHDFFIAKSLDALAPGGIMALVTSHYTLDKQNAAHRESLAERADFLGAIRLPSNAFQREGTSVVTDIVFLRKRAPGQEPLHADPEWLEAKPVGFPAQAGAAAKPDHEAFEEVPAGFEGTVVPINGYFLNHPEQVLGTLSSKDSLYGSGYSVVANGDLSEQLHSAVEHLPQLPLRKAQGERIEPAVIASPPEKHIAEGSYFLLPDRSIAQRVEGKTVPVVYGGQALHASGSLIGRRLASLIGLRDHARRVLQSQNEGWPEVQRAELRRELNRAYDAFTHTYGPINKTTFGETADGTTIRRMPNLVKFREDPDAMLVMALEEYDEVSGIAKKAPILLQDVVGKIPPITSVESAEAGLLLSLDQRGMIDLPYIASLYGKSEETVIAELGDLIYRDPETKAWQTADDYLSGNVRRKLAIAQSAGAEYARNAEALNAVQPEDVLPGDIDANLGAPWIPASDIRDFAAELFHVPASSFQVGRLERDAVWSIEGNYDAERSVAVTSDFGTKRISGIALLDLALNMKSPAIYDTINHGDREERVLNTEETLAAKEKLKHIKEKFRQWIFAEPERTERLVRLYNDTYNNLRPRLFDGSHLEFPGMSQGITLRQHQRDAIWRTMSSGNTLLAHAVGAGKTFTMIAAGMKMKQAGLVRKPMFVVPNHMLEQFSREFLQLYPNARILVASKEDLTRERRKFLTAKIASGEWDGIVITHGSFERIGMSREYQEQFLREQIAEYDELLIERARDSKSSRNIIKNIEKQKARREARLKDLLAEDKKDDGLVFDELGVDHIFIDEAHYFKNLETPTKMERVAGIQTGGSERAFDLFMKSRYLGMKHPGHGVTFATGTPVSNTMMELYTVQRYLDPAGLSSRGIEPFDAWAATFGEVVETMEISPDGASLRPRSRFAKFVNLPELQQMIGTFADVQTAEMLNLPRPALEGGKPHIVACPMSEEQLASQQKLVERYDRIRSTKVDPREDNALAITTDGRKLALDARMLTPGAKDFPGSKVNALVENVATVWKKTTPSRGTQMVFCDMGVGTTPWGFSVYDEIIEKLVSRGIPRSEIVAMGDADSDAKKQALFEKVRNGSVRVLLGSTQKMGTGTNVQKRLVALHHLDAPWKPAEVEQREGRILRQGNTNAEVSIYRYVTSGSFDAYMWQALETKARFISQIMSGEAAVRRADDVAGSELSYAEVKAIASGNPAVLTLAEADAELQRLAILRKNHADEQFLARRNLRELPGIIERLQHRLETLSDDKSTLASLNLEPFRIAHRQWQEEDAIKMIGKALNSVPDNVPRTQRFPLGLYRGLHFGIERHPGGAGDVYLDGKAYRSVMLSRESQGSRAVLNAVKRLESSYGEHIATVRKEIELSETQLRDFQARVGASFSQGQYEANLTELRDRLKLMLANTTPPTEPAGPTTADIAEEIKTLIGGQSAEQSPTPVKRREATRAEIPVTARLRRLPPKAVEVASERTTVIDEVPPNQSPRFQDRLQTGEPSPASGNSLI
jgi:N12 class adenine-specific DNA methylase/SAM-dependent methyltransferase